MGGEESKFDPIGEQGDTSNLNVGELLMSKLGVFLMETFSKSPNQSAYNQIIRSDKVLTRSVGPPYPMFKLKARDKWNLSPALTEEEKKTLSKKESFLLNLENKLCGCDLDTLWSLFYATGDQVYPDRVYSVSQDKNQHMAVKRAANWSYQSHIEKGLVSKLS